MTVCENSRKCHDYPDSRETAAFGGGVAKTNFTRSRPHPDCHLLMKIFYIKSPFHRRYRKQNVPCTFFGTFSGLSSCRP